MQNNIECYVSVEGEPTLQEQAKLFIEALDLGSSTYQTINLNNGDQSEGVTADFNGVVPRTDGIVVPLNRSSRSISAICGSPSTEICPRGKQIVIISNN